MERNLDNFLINWKEKKDRKPILLRGARQTGKSYAIEKLGKKFPNYICANFEKRPSLSGLFNKDLDPKRIIKEMSAIFETEVIPGKTLIFLDEIQNCPRAVTALRYFYEEMPDLHVAGAGSLFEFELGKISVPVGRIEYVYVRPLNFIEYLRACGNAILADGIFEYGLNNLPSEIIHNKILSHLREYLFVGGMPGVVNKFLKENSYLNAVEEQYDILTTFRSDFNKYCGRAGTGHISKVFEFIPSLIGHKVTYSRIDPDARAEQLKSAINLLEKAHILVKVKATTGSGIPLTAGASDKRYKLVFLDAGLMQCLMGTTYREWQENKNILSSHAGAVAEQFVGQELQHLNGEKREAQLFYWDRTARSSNAEIDYLSVIDGKIVPIEVKAGTVGRLKSMHMFLWKYTNVPVGIKVSEQNFSRKGNIISIPLYYVLQLNKIIEK